MGFATIGGAGNGVIQFQAYDPDFILGAQSQLSDESVATDNWCTGNF